MDRSGYETTTCLAQGCRMRSTTSSSLSGTMGVLLGYLVPWRTRTRSAATRPAPPVPSRQVRAGTTTVRMKTPSPPVVPTAARATAARPTAATIKSWRGSRISTPAAMRIPPPRRPPRRRVPSSKGAWPWGRARGHLERAPMAGTADITMTVASGAHRWRWRR